MIIVPQLGCVSQDSEAWFLKEGNSPEETQAESFGINSTGTIHSLRYVKQVSEKIKNIALEKYKVKTHHHRSPTLWNLRTELKKILKDKSDGARGKVWNLARNIHKLKEKDKTTFYSPAEEWIMPAASTIKPEEREFVVESRASMHTVSKKDLDSAELETMRISKNPTTVMTANGEVQTREEATVYVKELDFEGTAAVLSLGKLCEVMGFLTTGPLVKNHISPKMAKESIAM